VRADEDPAAGEAEAGLVREEFRQAHWNEPIIFEISQAGQRGVLLPEPEARIREAVGPAAELVPEGLWRATPPALPELSQKHVLAHYLHLSQETLGANLANDISQGTCTMKYNPRVNELLAADPRFAELHPDQDEETVQGILEIYHRFGRILLEISGMAEVSLQPGGGSHAVFAAARMLRAYFARRGEGDTRDEVITTVFSHPCNAAAPATAGFKVITIYPGEDGLPDPLALKAAVSSRTAGIFMTNPEDIGLYNPRVREFIDVVHQAGGLAFYDQANANGFLGVARAREAGFDICHFNVHKTFGAPHGSFGPGNGALLCTEELAPFLPVPLVAQSGDGYRLDYDRPQSIGKIRDFFGTAGVVLRAYAWVMTMGAAGLREAADVSVLNNSYLMKRLEGVPGLDHAFAGNGLRRMEQVRYSWRRLKEETGVGTEDVHLRVADFGLPHYFLSHHPWLIAEPMTLEPCETYSIRDMDEYAAVLHRVAAEGYREPELVRSSPHRSAAHRRKDDAALSDPARWALTWRAHLRKGNVRR